MTSIVERVTSVRMSASGVAAESQSTHGDSPKPSRLEWRAGTGTGIRTVVKRPGK